MENGASVVKNGNASVEKKAHFIQLRGVTKSFETLSGKFHALKAVSLSVRQGKLVAITGKSGSGKSTLLNMLTGIDRPSAGAVIIGGTPIQDLSEGELALWRGKSVGIVFQFFQLLPTLSILENVMLPMDFTGSYPPGQRRGRAFSLLSKVGIADQADKLPASLSGGQQQRAAIARALANDPPFIVADEPTGNLDSHTAEGIFSLFEELSNAGKTVLVVTHEREISRRFAERVTLADGEVAAIEGNGDTRYTEEGRD